MRIFDFKKDYYQLVSTSNAYAEIRNRWINHPLLEEISEKLHKENCCGASSHFNAFIEYLEETCIELNRVIEENHKEKLYSMKTTKGESHDFY